MASENSAFSLSIRFEGGSVRSGAPSYTEALLTHLRHPVVVPLVRLQVLPREGLHEGLGAAGAHGTIVGGGGLPIVQPVGGGATSSVGSAAADPVALQVQVGQAVVKRGRGRPPGSKDKKKRIRRTCKHRDDEDAAEASTPDASPSEPAPSLEDVLDAGPRPRGRPRGSKDSVPRIRRWDKPEAGAAAPQGAEAAGKCQQLPRTAEQAGQPGAARDPGEAAEAAERLRMQGYGVNGLAAALQQGGMLGSQVCPCV
mmetsp:Transcript_40121/g.93955  ORF Transcript_40121/g.93955 Transcript_40121/m.93955 type:complete len:255 (+) Transcript_40121:105-869(+)